MAANRRPDPPVAGPPRKRSVADRTLNDLCTQLLHFAGETGESEGASDTLARLLRELAGYRRAARKSPLPRRLRTLARKRSRP